MRAVIYTRVSLDRKQRGKSVAQQEDECRSVCASLGWQVAEVFTDNNRSASRYATKDRPGYQALVTYLQRPEVDVLVLWESSRGDRELESWAGLLNLCRRRGTRIHVVEHRRTYDLDVPRDWKTLAEDGVGNAYASDETRQRILRDVRAQAAKGMPHGKLSFGYSRRYDERGNFVEQFEVPEQGAILREAARRVLAGESCYAVAQDLNARGVASPGDRKWIGTEVKRLLINPSYIGKRVLNSVIVGDAVWPAILTEKDHHRLVAMLTDPARKTFEDGSVKHLLTGLALCAVCGGPMRPGKNRTIRSYMCRLEFCTSMEVGRLEGFVTVMVVGTRERHGENAALGRLGVPGAAELFIPADVDEDRTSAGDEVKTLKARLESYVVQAATTGKPSPAVLARIEAELAPMIADAERRARPVPTTPALDKLLKAGVNARAVWDDELTIQDRRAVLGRLVEVRVDVDRRGRGHRTFNPARLGESRWVGDEKTWAEHGLV